MLESGVYWNRAKYYEEAFADFGDEATNGDDKAQFWDSAAADELYLYGDYAEFWNGPSSGSFDYHHKAEGLGSSSDDVELQTDTGHATTDTILQNLTYYDFTEIQF